MELESLFYKHFEKYLHSNMSFVLGISGGPDSMFMFFVLEKYLISIGFDLANLHIAHFNHRFRSESFGEVSILKDKFSNYNFHTQEYNGVNFTESDLRKARHEFFNQVLDNIQGDKVLVLGHNLTDRIETTFLNMLRGSSKEGLLNMKMYEKHKTYSIFRPLLDTPKDKIIDYCNDLGITYFTDLTNLDNSVSLRNKLRNGPIEQLIQLSNKSKDGNNKFFDSFRNLYSILDDEVENKIVLEEIELDENWNADYGFKLISQLENIQSLVNLFKQLRIYNNISNKNLLEIYNFLIKCNRGYKLFKGVYFFRSHGQTYIIKGPLLFWQKRFADIKKIIKIGYISIRNYNINIDKEEYLDCELGFFNSFDATIRGKLKKAFINKKIPIFKRMFTLVIVKDNKILKIYHK
ncbi:MAG: tRNA lysidine(34) synthetase TilS [Candidatus Absconditabacteria bacterium]